MAGLAPGIHVFCGGVRGKACPRPTTPRSKSQIARGTWTSSAGCGHPSDAVDEPSAASAHSSHQDRHAGLHAVWQYMRNDRDPRRPRMATATF